MVPKRLPPRPHSFSWSRSPLRHCAAAKPSQVIKPNSATKTMSAVQLTSCMISPRLTSSYFLISSLITKFRDADAALIFGRKINDRGQNGADDDPEQLIPIKERHTDPGWLELVVERRPDDREELDHEEQVPPAPSAALAALLIAVLQAHIAPRRSVPMRANELLRARCGTITGAFRQIKM